MYEYRRLVVPRIPTGLVLRVERIKTEKRRYTLSHDSV
jgi:hypothetical protein